MSPLRIARARNEEVRAIGADMDMDGAMLDESTKPDLAKPAPKSKPKPAAAKNPVAKKAATPPADPRVRP